MGEVEKSIGIVGVYSTTGVCELKFFEISF